MLRKHAPTHLRTHPRTHAHLIHRAPTEEKGISLRRLVPSYNSESNLFSSQDVFFQMKLQEAMSLSGKERSTMAIRIVGSILLDMEPRFALLGRFCMPAICGALGSIFTEVKANYLAVSSKRSLKAPPTVHSPLQHLKPIPGVTSGNYVFPGFESALPSLDRLQIQQRICSQSYCNSYSCLKSELKQLEQDRVHYAEDLLVLQQRQSTIRSGLERVFSLWRYQTLRDFFRRFKILMVRKKARTRFSEACHFLNRLRPDGSPLSPMVMHVWFTWRQFTKNSRLSRLAEWHKERQALVDEFKYKIHVFNSNAAEVRHSINKMKDQVEELSDDLVVRSSHHSNKHAESHSPSAQTHADHSNKHAHSHFPSANTRTTHFPSVNTRNHTPQT